MMTFGRDLELWESVIWSASESTIQMGYASRSASTLWGAKPSSTIEIDGGSPMDFSRQFD
jgi:hypothetical protein